MDKRAIIIGTIGAGLLGLALVLSLSWLLSLQPRGAALRSPPSQHFLYSGFRSQVSGFSQGTGLDTGLDAIKLANVIAQRRDDTPNGKSEVQSAQLPDPSPFALRSSLLASGGWMRLRGIDLKKVAETRQALHKLRAEGLRTCVFLRRSVKDWKVAYLPDDLRETYEHSRQLGAAFGDLVDAWEVDNEPDLGFVPESAERYTALLKASYLGLQRGFAEAKTKAESGRRLGADGEAKRKSEIGSQNPQVSGFSPQVSSRAPLVIMGSLGLPPGPWLERFAANDGFAYTDGYNYHYYGYAEDFTGVYRQHEAAVKELSKLSTLNAERSTAVTKLLPIFLTEIGYGMLGKQARDTKEGRLRQWRWFKSIGEQVAQLRIEGAMAFYLPPYLEYDTSEYGMTVPAKPVTEKAEGGNLKAEVWIAGGIQYAPTDFGADKAAPWMKKIGTKIGGNEITPALAQWLAPQKSSGFRSQVSGFSAGASRSWSVTTAPPSPVVIDFLPGEGLSPVKRYHGSFVTGTATSREQGAKSKEPTPPSPPRPSPSAIHRREEFIIQVRTKNGNLYEVYPTRQATPEWQHFMEPQDNFTMSFYGRAELPWRFKDNLPASLVVVLYPKQLPTIFEFRHPMLTRLGEGKGASNKGQVASSEATTNRRYGSGRIILYNFSDKPVTGRLHLPDCVAAVAPSAEPLASAEPSTVNRPPLTGSVTLAPGERREVSVNIQVAAESFTRIEAPISFVPEDTAIPTARFLTAWIPDIAGMKATLVAELLRKEIPDGALGANMAKQNGRSALLRDGEANPKSEKADKSKDLTNLATLANRPRAAEEAPSILSSGFKFQVSGFKSFAQPGAAVERTAAGFTVTVTSIPSGKPQRIEVELPWPDGLDFPANAFLSVEFRLR